MVPKIQYVSLAAIYPGGVINMQTWSTEQVFGGKGITCCMICHKINVNICLFLWLLRIRKWKSEKKAINCWGTHELVWTSSISMDKVKGKMV